ncbi:MAG: hypothetical protein N2446_02490 [Elusimicrobiales bacterium]|nr:hypothetical protein [Elusimicrobiales bacterium]
MIKKIKESTKLWLLKWYKRFKTFVYLFSTWAVIYSTVNVLELSIGFEYDDVLAYTSQAYLKAKNLKNDEFYKEINENSHLDRIKIIPFIIYKTAKLFGFSTDIIIDRKNISTKKILSKWKDSKIYFVSDSNEKYEIINNKKYLIFFANSDDGIIQAKKANVYPIRIKRNQKSLNPLPYNPGKFGEKQIPLSQF